MLAYSTLMLVYSILALKDNSILMLPFSSHHKKYSKH